MKWLGNFALYLVARSVCFLVRLLPYSGVKALATLGGWGMMCGRKLKRVAMANLTVAFPEWSETARRAVMKKSFYNLALNLLEFVWLSGIPKRIQRCYEMPEAVQKLIRDHSARQERIIFVNPHLGSWEASGLMAPYYGQVPFAAIAKPVRNPYLNKLLNQQNRGKVANLKVIFSRGAMKATIKALQENYSIGTLIDQNTRVRDGGAFIQFFGLPVPCSKAPAVLARYCKSNHIPLAVYFGVSIREADGVVRCLAIPMSKPLEEYANDEEYIQELLTHAEEYVRRYPEQYLWIYSRFCYMPMDASEALAQRFPFYAKRTDITFYDSAARRRKKEQEAAAQA